MGHRENFMLNYRVFGFKPHYFKVNFFQDAWIFFTYFLHNNNVHAIRSDALFFICMHSKRLQAFDFNRMQVFSGPYLLHSKRFLNHGREIGQVMVSFVNCENEIHRSRKSLFSRKLFSRKWKIRERNPEHVPPLRAAITEICRTITPEMCASACRNVNNRLLRCVANNDGCSP